jgi:hypothetical protein
MRLRHGIETDVSKSKKRSSPVPSANNGSVAVGAGHVATKRRRLDEPEMDEREPTRQELVDMLEAERQRALELEARVRALEQSKEALEKNHNSDVRTLLDLLKERRDAQ